MPVYIARISQVTVGPKVSNVNGKMQVVPADFFHHLKPKIVDDRNESYEKRCNLPLQIFRPSYGFVAGFLRNNVGLMNDPARYEIAFSLIFSQIYLLNAGVESYKEFIR